VQPERRNHSLSPHRALPFAASSASQA
jgi:hypothetical protein